jgi:hypothetical protein
MAAKLSADRSRGCSRKSILEYGSMGGAGFGHDCVLDFAGD